MSHNTTSCYSPFVSMKLTNNRKKPYCPLFDHSKMTIDEHIPQHVIHIRNQLVKTFRMIYNTTCISKTLHMVILVVLSSFWPLENDHRCPGKIQSYVACTPTRHALSNEPSHDPVRFSVVEPENDKQTNREFEFYYI